MTQYMTIKVVLIFLISDGSKKLRVNVLLFPLDLDECREPGYCEHGRCANFIGGFSCRCNSGYVRSDDNRTCVGR